MISPERLADVKAILGVAALVFTVLSLLTLVVVVIKRIPEVDYCELRWRDSGFTAKDERASGCMVTIDGMKFPERSVKVP